MRTSWIPGLSVLLTVASGCGGAPVGAPQSPSVATVSGGHAELAEGSQIFPSEDDAAVPVNSGDPVWGSRKALVTVVVFGDLQCPYTAKVLPTIHALEKKYGPDDLRVVWKDAPLPFHNQARPAAEAAGVVYQLGKSDAFWRFWELALGYQADLAPAAFEAWAASSGVDAASYQRLLGAHASATEVDRDLALAKRLEVFGTPTFFVNGTRVVGAQPLEQFVAAVDTALGAAKAKLSSGVAADRLYATLAAENYKPPPPDKDDDEKEDDTAVWNVPIAGAPVVGSKTAVVTIVEFSDFQCPFCKRVEPTLAQIRTKYGDKVRIVWRDDPLPFHPRARPAAELAREARAEKGDAGFWKAHDAIFESQPSLEDADFERIARALGLDVSKVRSAVTGARFQRQIDADADLADDVDASGTPHFFINGRRLSGAQPFERFQALIDEEIQHGEKMLAAGTPPLGLYDAIIKGGKAASPPEARTVPARAEAPWKGAAKARVVIEEFADFQCPFCASAEPTLLRIAREYGSSVKFVWRNLPLPFHKHAIQAAEAALEAQHQKGNAAFWSMHDRLFAHQGDGSQGEGLDRPALERYASEIGLDVAAFDRALDQHTHRGELDADGQAAEAARVDGAPTFFVGGYVVSGAQPYEKFRRVIEHVIASGPARP